MLIGYMRVSKADGSQTTDLRRDALLEAGVDAAQLYEDHASGRLDARPGLVAALKALRAGDALVVWKLDRLGRDLRHLINTVHDLTERGVGLKVLTGQGAAIDTTTPAGKLIFGIFAALAEFERELIAERTKAGLAAARASGLQLILVDALRIQALIELRQRHWRVAEAALEGALQRTRAMAYPHAEAKALWVYGQLEAARGDTATARERFEQALAICDRLGEGLYRPHIEHAVAALDAPPGDP